MQAQLSPVGGIPPRWLLAGTVFLLGVLLAYLVGAINRRLLVRAGVPEVIEGTAFERMARELGTSTVSILAKLSTYFVLILALIVALAVARIQYTTLFLSGIFGYIPQLFIALLILIIGVVVGDKVELMVQERLSEVKVPDVQLLPTLAKYGVFYVAAVIALNQIGIAVLALNIVLAFALLAAIVFTTVAFWDLFMSGAAGLYLLLNQPYGIGDEVRMGEQQGIVQEVDVFVTHIESDGEEYVVPNNKVFQEGIVRIRN